MLCNCENNGFVFFGLRLKMNVKEYPLIVTPVSNMECGHDMAFLYICKQVVHCSLGKITH
jgi:hypothetical protein